jgi:hypothetical protein
MRVLLCSLLLVACAGKTPPPVADPNGPHAANETVTGHGGNLELEAWPQNGVEVRGEKIDVWVFLEGAPGTVDELSAAAREQAAAELAKFIEVAAQQLDLQLQSAGQEPASTGETEALRARLGKDLVLGEGQRAWQNLTREDQPLCRIFMRYSLPFASVASAIEAALGQRPYKADIARRVVASFDSNAR